jgi:hypothetical protein
LHDGKSGAHLDVKKTLHKVRKKYFSFALRKDVENWSRKCDVCNSRRGTLRASKAPLQTYNVGTPNERIAINNMGPFVKTNKGNKYLMVVGDLFSKSKLFLGMCKLLGIQKTRSFVFQQHGNGFIEK